jgi:hypothetical protein
MRSTHTDPTREDRIYNEVIVDCYDESEERLGWFYYVTEEADYPFSALVRLPQKGGQSEEKTVEVVGTDPNSENGGPLRMGITEPAGARARAIRLTLRLCQSRHHRRKPASPQRLAVLA